MKKPEYDEAWSDEVKALYTHDLQEIWDRSLAPHVWAQYHNQLDIYLAFAKPPARDILDVGCAQATAALLLAEQGHRVTAVDLRQEFLDYARTRYTHGTIRFISANALADEIDGEYDIVYANQIIEHLVYPADLVRKISKLLRPGGRLVISTPNADYFKNELPTFTELGDPRDWEHMQFTADGDGHFFAYTREELMRVFAECGFPYATATFFESPFISGHVKVRHVYRWIPAPVLKMLDVLSTSIPFLSRRLSHQILITAVKGAN